MTSLRELYRWLQSLNPDNSIAVDDGGLTLVELDGNAKPTGNDYEVGGIPEAEEEDNADEETTEPDAPQGPVISELVHGCQAAMAYLVDPRSRFKSNRDAAKEIIENALRRAKKGASHGLR